MYKLSLIIPVYNVEEYIRECIESVILDLPKNVQIICVNDGTPDNSMEIVKLLISELNEEVQKQFLLVEQDNQGLSGARNTGIVAAEGKYIGFLDSDDKLLPNYFDSILELINENYDIIDFNIESSNGDIISVRKGNTNNLESVFKASSWYSWARVYKKEMLCNYKFTEGIYYEDLAHTPLLYMHAIRTKHLPKVLYWYRQNPEGITLSVSVDKNNKTKESLIKIINYYYDFYLKTKNRYYAILTYQSLFILSKIICHRISLNQSFKFLADYDFILKSIDFEKLNINSKYVNHELIAFNKKPRTYIFIYKLYKTLK